MVQIIRQNQFSQKGPNKDYFGMGQKFGQSVLDARNRETSKQIAAEMASAEGTSLQSLMQSPKFQELQANAPEMANNLITLGQQKNLQRLSNLGQGAYTMMDSIAGIRDPKQKEKALRDLIQQRKALLPQFGFGTKDTEDLEKVLNEEGLDAALGKIDTTLQTAKSMGFALPKPNTPSIKSTRIGKAVTPGIGDREIFYVTDQGLVPSGYAAVKGSGGIHFSVGGEKHTDRVFNELWNERKSTQRTVQDIHRIQKMLDNLGPQAVGSLGASGKIAKGLSEGIQALSNTVKNLGLESDVDDPSTRVTSVLQGTNLHAAAMNNQQFNSLLTNLAYVVAKQNDPGGRISGPDFDAAVRQIAADADNPAALNQVITNLGNKFIENYRRDVEDYSQLPGATSLGLLRNVRGFEPFEKRQSDRALGPSRQRIYERYQKSGPNDLIDINGLKVTRSQLEQVASEEGKSIEETIKETLRLMEEQQQGAQ